MVWIALSIFFGCYLLARGLFCIASALTHIKVKIVCGKTEYKIETSHDGAEIKGHIWTRIH